MFWKFPPAGGLILLLPLPKHTLETLGNQQQKNISNCWMNSALVFHTLPHLSSAVAAGAYGQVDGIAKSESTQLMSTSRWVSLKSIPAVSPVCGRGGIRQLQQPLYVHCPLLVLVSVEAMVGMLLLQLGADSVGFILA